MLEDLPGRDREARRARARHHLERQDRVAAQLEEVSRTPTAVRPRSSAQIPARASSACVRGAAASPAPSAAGAGSARRSILP
ncbi:hypothetical protein BE20_29620 [Sorangium cellulosum]|nr:hypothetical protein BE20_29620 [Sorangium cellulosum]